MGSITTLPDFAVALTLLNQTQLQRDNPALYNILKYLIDANIQNQNTVVQTTIPAAIAAIPPSSSDVAPDAYTIRIQPTITSLLDSGLLHWPLPDGAWSLIEGTTNNAIISTLLGCSGCAATANTQAIATVNGVPWARWTISGGGANSGNVSNATQDYHPVPVQGSESRLSWLWGNILFTGGAATFTNVRLRMGIYAGTIGNAALQSTNGVGIRLLGDDGTSPPQFILEQYDLVTRTTTAKFGSYTAGHYYRCILRITNPTGSQPIAQAEVWDITAGTVSVSATLNVTTGALNNTNYGLGTFRCYNTNATVANVVLIDVKSFTCYTIGSPTSFTL